MPTPQTTTMATTMALKPKERQFQVVPVPAIFTRGRWECRDFKEMASVENQILEFVEKQHAIATSNVLSPAMIPAPFMTTSEVPTTQKIVVLSNNPGNTSLITSTLYNTNDNTGYTIDNNNISNTNTSTNGNIVAIDNKIEQAMDLVKTHLTFAVREEVEILRSTIAELESRVNLLDNENQILRQFAPAEVVNNLPLLMQQHQKNNQQQQAAIEQQQLQKQASTSFSHLPPPPSSSPSISSVHESLQIP